MSKSTPKPAKPEPKASEPKLRDLIAFGLDENKKARAARFAGDDLGLLAKAAEQMNLTIHDVDSPELTEIAAKLPAGRLYATGRGFVPHVRPDLYKKIIAAIGGEAALKDVSPPVAQGLPRSFDEIAPGHLVIAQESLEYGWWEAIVLERNGDMLTLRYRDYPKLPKFMRHRAAVALMSPPLEPQAASSQA